MTLFDVDDGSPRPVSLVRLASLINRAASDIGRLAVEGEVHRPSTGAGRQWFTLRDRTAQISVSVPSAKRSRCRVVAGERVAVTGRLEWVPGWGQLQLVAEEIVPVGEGAIAAMIADSRRRLEAEGLTTRPRKPIPLLPAVIGVVCGREAAVRADIESVVADRFPDYPVVFVETVVSGPGAADQIIDALSLLDGRPDVEVIVLARGGGDATQLLPFSDEGLCRAVCACRTPVVSAIGHDGDRPLVDDVADLRCGTPSLAAGRVVPSRVQLVAVLDQLAASVDVALAGRLDQAASRLVRLDRDAAVGRGLDVAWVRLDRAARTLRLVHPAREQERAVTRLEGVDWRTTAARQLSVAGRRLGAAAAQADALSPVRVLERGYAVVRRAADGEVVRDPAQTPTGTAIEIQVARGSVAATVRP